MRTILIADDSTTIQRVVEHAFAETGVRVVAAADGPGALDAARREKPDLVLCDVLMPGLTGYEVAEAMARDAATRDIPILLLSGAFEPFDEGRATRCGAVGHLAKPFESAALRRRVDEILARAPVSRRIPVESAPARAAAPPADETSETTPRERAPAPGSDPFSGVDLAPSDWRGSPVPLPGDEDFDLSLSPSAAPDPLALRPGPAPADPAAVEVWREECRRQVAQLAPDIIREVAWEVVPDLLERLLRESVPPPPGAPGSPPEDEGDRRP